MPRRLLAALSLSISLVGGALSAAPQATNLPVRNTTGLVRHGPLDPVTRFPRWYEDTTGLRLKQCTDPGSCFFFPPDPALPVTFPDNWPDEMFYWAANLSDVGDATARMLYVAALEMAYVNGAIQEGDEMVFSRVRVRITGLIAGETYRVVHPYGVEVEVAQPDVFGVGGINLTRDIAPGIPGDFTSALHGDVGPFLLPVGIPTPPTPGTFISDGAGVVEVTGSPFGTNYVRVEGPGVGLAFPNRIHPDPTLGPDPFAIGDVIEFVQFGLQGQVADVMDVELDRATLTKDAIRTSLDVWAYSAPGQSIQAAVDTGLFVNLSPRGSTGTYFGRIEVGQTAPRPTRIVLRNLTDVPATAKIYQEGLIDALHPPRHIRDGVFVSSAVFTIGGDLVLQAQSTEPESAPVLVPWAEGNPLATLLPLSTPGLYAGSAGIPLGVPPPTRVTVRSSMGGEQTVPVIVAGQGFIGVPLTPIIANAGPDITVSSGQLVSLTGAASTGPIVSYQWTHNAGALFSFTNPTSVTPTFTVPTITGNALDVLVTLRVTDEFGTPATDTMVIHILNPVAQDQLTITDARYNTRNRFWRVAGTARLRQAQRITIYLGASGNTSRVIGTAIVDGAGNWAFTGVTNSAVTTGTVPGAGDSTVWASSSLGGPPAVANFQVR